MATSMIITTNNLTVARMAVIACRTHSELMAGAKAMLIETAKRQMASGVCHFAYTKKNGEYREAWGTLVPSLVDKKIVGTGASRENYAKSAYWDCEKSAWRSFRWENIVAVY